jgi:chromosome partitioning protein
MELLKNSITPSELTGILGNMTIQGIYKSLKAQNINTVTINRRKFIPPSGVRKFLKHRGYTYPKINISMQIVKGGAGKTSLSFALAVRAAHYGAKILVIDFDQQGNLTRSLGVESRERPVWLNIIRDNVNVKDAIVSLSDNLGIIPSNLNNSRLDVELSQSNPNFRDMVRDKLQDIRNSYDLIIMDCPPAINKINTTAACASDLIIIPINPDPYAMDGLEFTITELQRIKKEFKLNYDYKIIWNRYDARERLGAVYMHALVKNEERAIKVMPVVIRADVSIKNAIFDSKSIFSLPKKTAIRDDIDQFTREVLGINAWIDKNKTNSEI